MTLYLYGNKNFGMVKLRESIMEGLIDKSRMNATNFFDKFE